MVAIRKHEDYSEVIAERAAVHGLLLNGKAVEQHKNQNQYRNYTMSCGHAQDFKGSISMQMLVKLNAKHAQ